MTCSKFWNFCLGDVQEALVRNFDLRFLTFCDLGKTCLWLDEDGLMMGKPVVWSKFRKQLWESYSGFKSKILICDFSRSVTWAKLFTNWFKNGVNSSTGWYVQKPWKSQVGVLVALKSKIWFSISGVVWLGPNFLKVGQTWAKLGQNFGVCYFNFRQSGGASHFKVQNLIFDCWRCVTWAKLFKARWTWADRGQNDDMFEFWIFCLGDL